MNTRELQYFITIADKGNLTQAADALFVSQPTLTKYLQRLEEQLGLHLFEHAHKSIVLTYAGKQYYDYAQNVLRLSKELQFKFDRITNASEGKIRIGLPPLLSSVVLGKMLPVYHEQFPGIDVEIIESNSANLEQRLRQGSIDIAIYMESSLNQNFAHQILLKDSMNIIFPKNMKVKSSYCIEELQQYPLLVGYPYQKHAQYINSLISTNHQKYKIIEGNNSIAGSILASNGYGISFLSNILCKFYTTMYHYNYSRLTSSQPLYIVAYYRKDNSLPTYVTSLLEITHATLHE